jgi:hypothetical protein
MDKMNLSAREKQRFLVLTRNRKVGAADVRPVQLILMIESGVSHTQVMGHLSGSSRFITRWSGRFLNKRLAGLYAHHPERVPKQPLPKLGRDVRSNTQHTHVPAQTWRWFHPLEQAQVASRIRRCFSLGILKTVIFTVIKEKICY